MNMTRLSFLFLFFVFVEVDFHDGVCLSVLNMPLLVRFASSDIVHVFAVKTLRRLTCTDCRRRSLRAGNLDLQIALLIRHVYDQLKPHIL